MKGRNLPNFEKMLCLDFSVILEERQEQEYASERELNAVETAPIRKGARPTVSATSIVVLDDEDYVNSGSSSVADGDNCKHVLILKQMFRLWVRHRRKRLPIRMDGEQMKWV